MNIIKTFSHWWLRVSAYKCVIVGFIDKQHALMFFHNRQFVCFVAACRKGIHIPASSDNCLFGDASNLVSVSSQASSGRTCVRSPFFCNEERVCSKCQESFAHLPSVTSQNKDSRGYTAVVTTDLAVNLLLKIGSLLDIRGVLGGPLLRHWATIRKVACLISTGIFHWLTPSGRTTAQRST